MPVSPALLLIYTLLLSAVVSRASNDQDCTRHHGAIMSKKSLPLDGQKNRLMPVSGMRAGDTALRFFKKYFRSDPAGYLVNL